MSGFWDFSDLGVDFFEICRYTARQDHKNWRHLKGQKDAHKLLSRPCGVTIKVLHRLFHNLLENTHICF